MTEALRHIHLPVVDSTLSEACRLWTAGARTHATPLLVTADTQTAGVGRTGRPWLSPAGGVWLTLVAPLDRRTGTLSATPLSVGLAVRLALLNHLQINTRLKWPNDLLAGPNDEKLAGILCRYEPSIDADVVIVGIGINANFDPSILGSALRRPATSLLALTGSTHELPLIARVVTWQVLRMLERQSTEGFENLVPEIADALAWIGRDVVLQLPGDRPPVVGELKGINGLGAIGIRTSRGIEWHEAGDLDLAEAASSPQL